LRVCLAAAGKGSPIRQTLETMGVEFKALDQLSREALQGCAALLAGGEPFRHNRGGIAAGWPEVEEFIRAGGVLVVFQGDDRSWPRTPDLAGVSLQEPRGVSGRIVAADDPLFLDPHRVTNLAGVRLYDIIERVAPPWKVLVTDSEGRPAVVRRALGRGQMLLVEPSYERLVAGATADADAEWRQAWMFLDNLLTWIERAAKTRAP